MTNKIPIIIIVLISIIMSWVIVAFVVPNTVNAQTPAPTREYQTLSPLSDAQKKVDLKDPKTYFTNMFSVLVSIISILAVIRLMLCGFQYMTSEAISSKEEAKKCIWTIIGGIFLLLLSYLILTTINKDLITLNFFDRVITEVENKPEDTVKINKTLSPAP